MSEARILPFRRPQPSERNNAPFLGLERVPDLNEWYDRLIVERHGWQAYAIGEALLKKTFQRLRDGHGPFPHERMTAFACGVSECVYRRRRAKFPAFFAFIDEQIDRAFARLSGKKPTKKPITFSSETSTKSKAAPRQIEETVRKTPQESFSTVSKTQAPDGARSAEGCATPPARPTEPLPIRRLLNHFDGCACPGCSRAREAEAESATPSPTQPPEVLAAIADALKQLQEKAPRAEPTAEQLAAAAEARKYLARVAFAPDGKGYLR